MSSCFQRVWRAARCSQAVNSPPPVYLSQPDEQIIEEFLANTRQHDEFCRLQNKSSYISSNTCSQMDSTAAARGRGRPDSASNAGSLATAADDGGKAGDAVSSQVGDILPWSIVLDEVLRRRESRRLAIFAAALTALAVLQAGYALAIDSLALLSDAMHMALHVGAVVISLVGMVYGRRPSTFAFSYGSQRFEVLAAFSNSLFLIFVTLFVLAGAMQRLLQPTIFGDEGWQVEFGLLGLVVNVAGFLVIGRGGSLREHLQRFHSAAAAVGSGRSFVAFSDGVGPRGAVQHPFLNTAVSPLAAPGAAAAGSAGSGSGAAGAASLISVAVDSGDGGSASGAVPPRLAGASASASNVDAVLLHFFSDAASSLAVIASSLLVRYRSLPLADTLAAVAVCGLTLYLTIPLFTATARILLTTVPPELAPALERCRRQAAVLEGVLDIADEHFWVQAPGFVVGSLTLRVRPDIASETPLLRAAQRIYAGSGVVQDLTVQVEREAGLGLGYGSTGGAAAAAATGTSDAVSVGSSCSGHGHGHGHGDQGHSHSHSHGHSHGHAHGRSESGSSTSSAVASRSHGAEHEHSHGHGHSHGHSSSSSGAHSSGDHRGHSHGGHGHDDAASCTSEASHGHSHGGHGHSHGAGGSCSGGHGHSHGVGSSGSASPAIHAAPGPMFSAPSTAAAAAFPSLARTPLAGLASSASAVAAPPSLAAAGGFATYMTPQSSASQVAATAVPVLPHAASAGGHGHGHGDHGHSHSHGHGHAHGSHGHSH